MKSFQIVAARSGAARAATRTLRTQKTVRPFSRLRTIPRSHQTSLQAQSRPFSSHTSFRIALTPDGQGGTEREAPSETANKEPADVSDAEYHELSDQYMNTLQLSLEEVADNDAARGLEVEYSAGVLTITHPTKGIYVINKQPPNKQIWLSSPQSGPKRFDWVLTTSASHDIMNSKQDTEGSTGTLGDDGQLGGGKWVYLRDGTSLTELLKDELDVIVAKADEPDAISGKEGPGGSARSDVGGGSVEG